MRVSFDKAGDGETTLKIHNRRPVANVCLDVRVTSNENDPIAATSYRLRFRKRLVHGDHPARAQNQVGRLLLGRLLEAAPRRDQQQGGHRDRQSSRPGERREFLWMERHGCRSARKGTGLGLEQTESQYLRG